MPSTHQLVDAVLEETGLARAACTASAGYFVLASASSSTPPARPCGTSSARDSAQVVVAYPCASSLSLARRRLGSAPLRRLFEILAEPVAAGTQTASFYRGVRVVAVDGTTLSIPDEDTLTWPFPECETRVLLGAAFGPDTTGELGYASRLLNHLDYSMVLLADACYDALDFLEAVTGTGAAFLVRSTRKRTRRCTGPCRTALT